MQEWNLVISVHEHGFKKAFDVFGDFGEVKRTEFFNVLLARADNVQEMLDALRTRMLERPDSLSFLARLIPVAHAFIFNSVEEFEDKAKTIVLQWLSRLADRRFFVRIHRRGFKGRFSSPEAERFLDTLLLEELEKSGASGKIDFEHPEAVIAVETIGHWAGLSFWTAEELEQYPFIRVV